MAEESKGPLLILVVDEDDDVGVKAGVQSPIIGREKNLEAALKLVMADPEDADANAMFAAIKILDNESSRWPNGVEIATVTGKHNGGLESDLKISREIESVIKKLGATECIVVSDGPLTPSLSSIISSRIKIVSSRTVIVKQSQTIETSWILFLRYLRMLVYDAPYSRIILGVPGVLLLLMGTLYFFNLLSLPLLLVFIGIALLIRGFGIDAAFSGLIRRLAEISNKPGIVQLRIFTAVVGLILIIVAFVAGFQAALNYLQSALRGGPLGFEQVLPYLGPFIGVLIVNSIDLIAIAAFLNTAYNIFYYYQLKSPRVWRHVQAMLIFFFLWIMMRLLGTFLTTQSIVYLIQLVLVALIGFASLLTSITIIRAVRGMRAPKQ
jgi:putative membrane protein